LQYKLNELSSQAQAAEQSMSQAGNTTKSFNEPKKREQIEKLNADIKASVFVSSSKKKQKL
jgi:hypothetical protein